LCLSLNVVDEFTWYVTHGQSLGVRILGRQRSFTAPTKLILGSISVRVVNLE